MDETILSVLRVAMCQQFPVLSEKMYSVVGELLQAHERLQRICIC